MTDLLKKYQKEIIPVLTKELGISNLLAVPHLAKIVVSVGLKEAMTDKKVMDIVSKQLMEITGQKPKVTTAKKSIAAFKLRAGEKIGLMVTLRGRRMYDFYEKLVTITLPRVRDFRGVSKKSFDGKGNYTLGFTEQIIFPEIEYAKIDKIRGLQISIVTTADNDKNGRVLLEKMGLPFEK